MKPCNKRQSQPKVTRPLPRAVAAKIAFRRTRVRQILRRKCAVSPMCRDGHLKDMQSEAASV